MGEKQHTSRTFSALQPETGTSVTWLDWRMEHITTVLGDSDVIIARILHPESVCNWRRARVDIVGCHTILFFLTVDHIPPPVG